MERGQILAEVAASARLPGSGFSISVESQEAEYTKQGRSLILTGVSTSLRRLFAKIQGQ
jgi:hypothetical protein